jgi:hypothetical protein
MPSKPAFTVIADAAVDALKAAGIAQGRIFHVIPDAAAVASSYVTVAVEGSEPERAGITGAPVDWTTALRVDCLLRFGLQNPRPHEDITQLFAEIYAALLGDAALAALALDVLPGPATWDYADEELQSAVVQAQFVVRHRTHFRTLVPV